MSFFYGNVANAKNENLTNVVLPDQPGTADDKVIPEVQTLTIRGEGNTTVIKGAQDKSEVIVKTIGNETFLLERQEDTAPSEKALSDFMNKTVAMTDTIIDCGTSADL